MGAIALYTADTVGGMVFAHHSGGVLMEGSHGGRLVPSGYAEWVRGVPGAKEPRLTKAERIILLEWYRAEAREIEAIILEMEEGGEE